MKKVIYIVTVMLTFTGITGVHALEENAVKQDDETIIETWREPDPELESHVSTLEAKTKESLNNNIKASLPVNAQFWEADVRYEVLGEGKVSIFDTNRFVSQSSDPTVLQVDSVIHDGVTYLITQVRQLDVTGYETVIMNNVDTFSNRPSGNWDHGGVKGIFPNVTEIKTRDDFIFLKNCFHTLELENVTSIPVQMFYRFDNLKEVSLPKVTAVEKDDNGSAYTFVESPIERVNMPSLLKVENRMFYDCNYLKTITLPSVQEIQELGFYGANTLEEVNLPLVKYVGKNAFRALSNLKEINMPEVEELGDNAFAGINPVNGVTEDVFSNKLTSISFPKLKSAGDGAFNGNIYLKNIDVPQLIDAGNYTFYRTGKNTEGMSIAADSLEKIGINSFAESGIKTAEFPKLKEVESSAFTKTNKLVSLDLPEATIIKDSAISLSAIKSISIPKVEKIEANAFRESAELVSVVSPNLKEIGNSAFYVKSTGSSSLKNIDLWNVEKIGDVAFRYCDELKEVELSKATNIGIVAFGNCTQLKTFKAPILESLSERVLAENINLITVELPKVKMIGYRSMLNCTNLVSLTLESIEIIEDEAFAISGEGKVGSFEKLYLNNQLPPAVENKNADTTLAFLNQKTPRYLYVDNAEAYRSVDDGNTNDNLWYGWTIVTKYQVGVEIIGGQSIVAPSMQEVFPGENAEFQFTISSNYELVSIVSSDAESIIEYKDEKIIVKNINTSQTITITLKERESSQKPEKPIKPDNSNEPEKPIKPDNPTAPNKPLESVKPMEPEKSTNIQNSGNDSKAPNENVQTGDITDLNLLIVLMISSFGIFVMIGKMNKKKNKIDL